MFDAGDETGACARLPPSSARADPYPLPRRNRRARHLAQRRAERCVFLIPSHECETLSLTLLAQLVSPSLALSTLAPKSVSLSPSPTTPPARCPSSLSSSSTDRPPRRPALGRRLAHGAPSLPQVPARTPPRAPHRRASSSLCFVHSGYLLLLTLCLAARSSSSRTTSRSASPRPTTSSACPRVASRSRARSTSSTRTSSRPSSSRTTTPQTMPSGPTTRRRSSTRAARSTRRTRTRPNTPPLSPRSGPPPRSARRLERRRPSRAASRLRRRSARASSSSRRSGRPGASSSASTTCTSARPATTRGRSWSLSSSSVAQDESPTEPSSDGGARACVPLPLPFSHASSRLSLTPLPSPAVPHLRLSSRAHVHADPGPDRLVRLRRSGLRAPARAVSAVGERRRLVLDHRLHHHLYVVLSHLPSFLTAEAHVAAVVQASSTSPSPSSASSRRSTARLRRRAASSSRA